MAQGSEGAYWLKGEVAQYDTASHLRLATWGALATVSLGLAVFSAHSSVPRPTAAYTESAQSTTSAVEAKETAANTERLFEAVRTLAADDEQLLPRIGSLERNLADITGSIKRDASAASQRPLPQITSTSSVAGVPAAAAPAPPSEMPVAASANVPASTPESPPPNSTPAVAIAAPDSNGQGAATVSNPVTAELGVDVGGALSFESLRTLWNSTKGTNRALPEELYPLVGVRENNKTLGADLRLIIGPLADAEAAARLCSTLSAEHRYCQPVPFEGQRLSLKSAPSVSTMSVRRPASGSSQNAQKPQ